MMNPSLKKPCYAGGAALVLLACASSPPPRELLDARAVYARLATTDAPKVAPRAFENARVALATAQESYATGMASYLVRDRVYMSMRASELAQVLAASQHDQAARAKALDSTAGSAADVRGRVSAAERARDQRDDPRANESGGSVTPSLASIKDEARGTVLTIPSQMLFLSESADFLPGASDRLEPVAKALSEQKGRNILVESGDESGRSQTPDMGLCLRRADRVRDFLVSHNVPPERIAVGIEGHSAPDQSHQAANGQPIVVSLRDRKSVV